MRYTTRLLYLFLLCFLLPAVCGWADEIVAVQDYALSTDRKSIPKEMFEPPFFREGARWNREGTVVLRDSHEAIEFSVSEQQAFRAIAIQADNNDTYILEGLLESGEWERLHTFPPSLFRNGLATRFMAKEDGGSFSYSRYRIRAGAGDGSFSVGKIALFTSYSELWENFSDEKVQAIKFPMDAGKRVFAILGMLVVLLALYYRKEELSLLPRYLMRGSLVLVIVLGFSFWFNLFQFHAGRYVHVWDFMHYYMGGKYFAEVGYDNIYLCFGLADKESGLSEAQKKEKIRDLQTNELVPTFRYISDNADKCRSKFSDERWSEFKRDVNWFRSRLTRQRWEELKHDHGFNATPVWIVAGSVLSNFKPLSNSFINTLAYVDAALLLLMWLVVWWTFGLEATAMAIIFWSTNFPAMYFWTGGSFLRHDWLVYLVLAVCCLKKEWYFLAGMLLSYSIQLRIFPGFIVSAFILQIIYDMYQRKSFLPSQEYQRFIFGGVLSVVLLVPASLFVSGDYDVYPAFVQNSKKHLDTELTNHMGLKTVVSYDHLTRVRVMRDNSYLDPFKFWKLERKAAFKNRYHYFLAAIVGFLVLLGLAVCRQPIWITCCLGAFAIPIFSELTCYYYGCILVVALLWQRYPVVAIGAVLTAWGTREIALNFEWIDESYTAQAALFLLLGYLSLGYITACNFLSDSEPRNIPAE